MRFKHHSMSGSQNYALRDIPWRIKTNRIQKSKNKNQQVQLWLKITHPQIHKKLNLLLNKILHLRDLSQQLNLN